MNFALNKIVPSFRLDGNLTILTGGAGGLSSVISRALIAQGSDVALVDIDLEITKSVADAITKWAAEELKGSSEKTGKVSAWACDVSDAANVEKTFAAINEHHGQIANNLVNSAGYCENIAAIDYPADKAEAILRINTLGSLFTAQLFARPLIAAKQPGSIILVGSLGGSVISDPQPQPMYNISKAAVIHLAKNLACEWSKYKIRVNSLSPGYIRTPMIDKIMVDQKDLVDYWNTLPALGRMSVPSEFVGSVLYLLSDSASSYTTGHDLVSDGGYMCY